MKKAYYCAILSAATLFLLQSSCSNGNKEDVKKDNKKSSEKVKDPKSKEVKEEFKIVLKDSLPDFIKENCSYRGGGNIACDKVDGKRMQEVVKWNGELSESDEYMERAKYKTSVAEISIGESPTGTVVIWTTVFFYYEGEFPDVEDLVLRNNPKRSGIKVDHGVEKLHEDKRIGPPKKREMFVKIKDRHKEYIKNGVNIVISNNDGLPRVSLKVDSTVTKQARYLLSNNNITEKVKISK